MNRRAHPCPPADSAAPSTPERWALNGGDAAQATLTIPPDALRQRRFEIACAITVAVPADSHAGPGAARPSHQMTVQANGMLQWQRRVDSHNPGEWDGLDLRFTREVPVGQSLRITVAVACSGSRRRSLTIEADELR